VGIIVLIRLSKVVVKLEYNLFFSGLTPTLSLIIARNLFGPHLHTQIDAYVATKKFVTPGSSAVAEEAALQHEALSYESMRP
jgi:hypothetical protein